MDSRHTSFTATLAVATLVTALAAPASAQTEASFTNDPIAIEAFSAYTDFPPSGQTTRSGIDVRPDSSEVRIAFVNTAKVAATSVKFTIRSGQRTSIIVDKGTFSPGARIVHTFDKDPVFDRISSVHVLAVTFADGSTWHR
jgi:hypothetical protein